MAWYDKVRSTATKTAKFAKDKSTDLYDITRMSFAINEKENRIDKLFKNIGMLTYRDYENGVEFSEDIALLMEEIDKRYEEIDELKVEINKIKNVEVCPECKKTNPNGANFCLSCGAKLK